MHVTLSMVTVRPGRIGGAETYARELLSALGAVAGRDQIALAGNRDVVERYVLDGLVPEEATRIVRGWGAQAHAVTRTARLASALVGPRSAALGDSDVVHYPVAVALPRTSLPTVVTLHDVQHHVLPEMFGRASRYYRALTYDRSARRADAVVTVSEHARGELIEHLELEPSRVIAIHHGIDHHRFSPGEGPRDDEMAEKLGLPERYIFYPANAWPHKNHRVLLEALRMVADTDVQLVLTGDLYGRETRLRGWIEELGLTRRVLHLGYVESAAIPMLYRRAVAMVFPSLFEGFGAPPLEAMATGCLVAVSSGGALQEVCGDAAVTFDPLDPSAVAHAIEVTIGISSAERTRRISVGVERSARYSWSKAAEQHLDVYRRVAA